MDTQPQSTSQRRITRLLSQLSTGIPPPDLSSHSIGNNSDPKYKILLCGAGYPLFYDVENTLISQGHIITRLPRPTNKKEAGKLLTNHIVVENNRDYDGVLCAMLKPFSKYIKGVQMPNLKVVSFSSSGIHSDDIAFGKQRGIAITNVPTETAQTTADLAVGLLIATARRFEHNRKYWKQTTPTERERNVEMNNNFGFCRGTKDVHGATVGLIGFGNIGKQIARRLSKGFGCNVRYFHGNGKQRKLDDVQYGAQHIESFEDLIRDSDFVVACCPLNDRTRYMLNEEVFRKMKNDAILINVGRGQLVDTNALIKALKEKWIRAAGLDVTDPEPLPIDHELWTMDNVTITPHIGSATEECRTRMMNLATDNMLRVLKGLQCPNVLK